MNKYLHTFSRKGSANELDDLIANRNVLLAQGRAGEAVVLDARIAQLKAKGMKPEKAACFSGDSKVLTPSGEIEIAKLKVGQKVISMRKNGERTIQTIKKVQVYRSAIIRRFHLSNGSVISATNHHTVLTDNGWKKLGDITIGDKFMIATNYGKSEKITLDKITVKGVGKVYNLHTTGPHNFIVNGMVAHNFTFARRLRSLYHDLREFSPGINLDISFNAANF